MSKRKKQKTKSRATTAAPVAAARPAPKPKPAARVAPAAGPAAAGPPLVFGAETYKWLGLGFLLVVVGFLLMIGGRGDDPSVFDESVIYSFRKITLAPIVILAGLGVTTYAIFKK